MLGNKSHRLWGYFQKNKSELESKHYVLTLESNISDIESNISKGIYVKPMSLYEKDTSMVGKVNDMMNPFGSKGNSFRKMFLVRIC